MGSSVNSPPQIPQILSNSRSPSPIALALVMQDNLSPRQALPLLKLGVLKTRETRPTVYASKPWPRTAQCSQQPPRGTPRAHRPLQALNCDKVTYIFSPRIGARSGRLWHTFIISHFFGSPALLKSGVYRIRLCKHLKRGCFCQWLIWWGELCTVRVLYFPVISILGWK